jgi:hypothetical protein
MGNQDRQFLPQRMPFPRSAPVVECELPCQSKAASPLKRMRQCQAMTGMGQIATGGGTSRDGSAALEFAGPQTRGRLKFNLLRDAEGVIHLNPEISDRTLQLGVPQQQLHSS